MADFTTIALEMNIGTLGAPSYQDVGAANTEVRWHNTNSVALNTASASWPAMNRPVATAAVSYTYAFSADATGKGVIDAGANVPTLFVETDYKWSKWSWDNVGTFASAPIFTAYKTTSHDSSARGDGSILGGHATDTGATARSYIKGNAFGRVDTGGAPAAAPANAPTVTDGATGSSAPTAGANWLTNFQALNGDTDYISFPSTPAATTADHWSIMFCLFTGPNMTPATHTPILCLKYTWT
jgi:hypothetical protein